MNAIDVISEKILNGSIGKPEALKSFETLSEEQQMQLISLLRSSLAAGSGANAPGRGRPLLRALHERHLGEGHKGFIETLSAELARIAPKSKENASKYQPWFVDQRKTGGLKKSLKPLQFHLTYAKAEGPYLHDVDGNKYVDIAGDNGVNLFGNQPEFIKEAIKSRLDRGYPLVGYTEELFEAARLFSEITGHERVLFTQSGTEAVMWACRIARAATQKGKIVIFDGAFHGLSDTVLAARDQFGKSLPMGLGMLQEFADQLIVLEYGKLDQLAIIEERSDEIAGVLVEPVQSRNPSHQPVEFLKELRKLTLEREIPLIFDEMITGFRICARGAQGYFGIKADIATYGKIPGGGMPTGMIAGSAKYMNFVDGGPFRYDDDTMPSARKSLMAGTHTRNPIKIVACLAALQEIKRVCSCRGECDAEVCGLKRLNEKTRKMAEEINAYFSAKRVPAAIDHFGSLFRLRFLDDPHGMAKELLLILLRLNGVETSPSGNCFLTLTHGDGEIAQVVAGFRKSVDTLLSEGFFFEAPEEPVAAAPDPAPAQAERAAPAASSRAGKSPRGDSARDVRMDELRKLIVSDLRAFQEKGEPAWSR